MLREPTESNQSKSERTKLRGNRFTKAVAGFAIATSAVTGLSGCGDDAEAAPAPTTTVSAEATTPEPTPSASETAPVTSGEIPSPAELIDPTVMPRSWVEQGTFDYLTPEAQQEVTTLGAISTEEFRQLDEPRQTAWAMFIVENALPRINYKLELNNELPLAYVKNPTTGQEIMDNSLTVTVVAANLTYIDESTEAHYDLETAEKLGVLTIASKADIVLASTNWDSLFQTLTPRTLWNMNQLVQENKSTVTAEAWSADGSTVALDWASEKQHATASICTKTIYTDILTGTEQHIYTFADDFAG